MLRIKNFGKAVDFILQLKDSQKKKFEKFVL